MALSMGTTPGRKRFTETKRFLILVPYLRLNQMRRASVARSVVSKLLHFSFVLFQGLGPQKTLSI